MEFFQQKQLLLVIIKNGFVLYLGERAQIQTFLLILRISSFHIISWELPSSCSTVASFVPSHLSSHQNGILFRAERTKYYTGFSNRRVNTEFLINKMVVNVDKDTYIVRRKHGGITRCKNNLQFELRRRSNQTQQCRVPSGVCSKVRPRSGQQASTHALTVLLYADTIMLYGIVSTDDVLCCYLYVCSYCTSLPVMKRPMVSAASCGGFALRRYYMLWVGTAKRQALWM